MTRSTSNMNPTGHTPHDDIKLRSEKVRRLIDMRPPMIVRIGMPLLIILFLLLAAALYLIPYPYGPAGENVLTHILHILL